ncbi:hypothetical protein ACTDI4_09965 [Mesorhizobium sp. PUT5]
MMILLHHRSFARVYDGGEVAANAYRKVAPVGVSQAGKDYTLRGVASW